MKTWILILFVSNHSSFSGIGTSAIEFNSKETCMKAGELIVEKLENNSAIFSHKFWFCVEK